MLIPIKIKLDWCPNRARANNVEIKRVISYL